VQRPEGRASLQIVARALCRVRVIPLSGIPVGDRQNYLRTQLTAWAPFDDSAFAIAMFSGHAVAWAWDQQAFEERARAAGLPTRPPQVWPETLLLPRGTDGTTLQRCCIGVEGQVWRAGQLAASRWWPQPPDPAAWLNFMRGAGGADASGAEDPATASAAALVPELPAGDEADWRDRPWAEVSSLSSLLERARLRGHALAAVTLTLLLLPTLWLAQARWSVGQEVDALRTQIDALGAGAQPLIGARNEALAALSTLDAFTQVVDRPDGLALLAHLAERLPADGNRVRNLEWEGLRLRLVLAVPSGASRIRYVEALEGGGWLHNVREDSQGTGPGTVALVAEIGRPGQAARAPVATEPRR
jgi:Tfp pilus assembly protein PilN